MFRPAAGTLLWYLFIVAVVSRAGGGIRGSRGGVAEEFDSPFGSVGVEGGGVGAAGGHECPRPVNKAKVCPSRHVYLDFLVKGDVPSPATMRNANCAIRKKRTRQMGRD